MYSFAYANAPQREIINNKYGYFDARSVILNMCVVVPHWVAVSTPISLSPWARHNESMNANMSASYSDRLSQDMMNDLDVVDAPADRLSCGDLDFHSVSNAYVVCSNLLPQTEQTEQAIS